jgi:hypothetical protein
MTEAIPIEKQQKEQIENDGAPSLTNVVACSSCVKDHGPLRAVDQMSLAKRCEATTNDGSVGY